MTIHRNLQLMLAVCGVLFALCGSASAQIQNFVDDFENLGPDGTNVITRVLGPVNVTITPASGLMTARTYSPSSPFAFSGSGQVTNSPNNSSNVSGTRFISTTQQAGVGLSESFATATPLGFAFSQPVQSFRITTIDLLEVAGNAGETVTLRALDTNNNVIDLLQRATPQGPAGLDLDWQVSAPGNDIAGVAFGTTLTRSFGYGLDDMGVSRVIPGPLAAPAIALALTIVGRRRRARR